MDTDVSTRYRSRILREMNANRDNPFNSPPSSTGSHGTVSPTLTSVISDIDGESTRKLNADIARVTSKKFHVNWEAAHRKWPDFYDLPSGRASTSEKQQLSAYAARFDEESTHDAWLRSTRTRAEMQPSVESDTSTALSGKNNLQSPSLHLPQLHQRTSLGRAHSRSPQLPRPHSSNSASGRTSASDMLAKLRAASGSPNAARPTPPRQTSQRYSLDHQLNSSPTLQSETNNNNINNTNQLLPNPSPRPHESTVRSFCLPDISYLGDFVSGTLRFNGKVKNGVPILVKHGRVVDLAARQPPNDHADVDGLEIPEDEERIFVSMDMIRDEIVTLQEHHDGVERYAEQLQAEIEDLQSQVTNLKMRRSVDSGFGSGSNSEPDGSMYEQLLSEKKRLEAKVAELQRLLDDANRRVNDEGSNNDTLSLERDRAVKKLQEACHNIGDLMDKLDIRDRQLQDTQKQLDATLQSKDVGSDLRSEMDTLRQAHDAAVREAASLKETVRTLREEHKSQHTEIESLRADNNSLRREQESLMSDNRSLRTNARNLMTEIESLRKSSDTGHLGIDAAKEEIEALQHDVQALQQEKSTFKEDNDSLVRHNEKYFNENKILRRENSGFERSLHDLHEENLHLKEEVEFLKQQLDHCRPIGKDDLSGNFTRREEEGEENMTSGFIIPDITLHRKDNAAADQGNTETDIVPPTDMTQTEEVTNGEQDRSMDIRETIEKDDSIVVREMDAKVKKKSRSARDNNSQKVAFSVPAQEAKPKPNVAAKRRSVTRDSARSDFARALDFTIDDSTGYQSTEPTQTQTQTQTHTHTHSLAVNTRTQTAHSTTKTHQAANAGSRREQQPSRAGHRSAASTRQQLVDNTVDTTASAAPAPAPATDKNACPALSDKARRVLDALCEHSCSNCVVCSRIMGHGGTVTAADRAAGKKRIAVPRPVAVTDRPAVGDDPTMRPAQSPGVALAVVIKGLEDEAAHLGMALAALQARYAAADRSLDRRGRRELAAGIKAALRTLEVKNDQVYALYDVLEGQKVAGQEMSEDELEVTVFSIAGVSIRDLTVTENVTWNGIDG